MDISEYGVSPNADPIVRDLEKYDLLKHAVELEAYGMTVVPPEKMGSTPTRSARTSRTWRPSPRSCTRARIRTPDDRVGSHGAGCRRRLA